MPPGDLAETWFPGSLFTLTLVALSLYLRIFLCVWIENESHLVSTPTLS